MSDTPRTDAVTRNKHALEGPECREFVRADFARELERESDWKSAWIVEIFRKLNLPSGDMGALENLITEHARLQKEVRQLRMSDCEKMGGLE